MPTLDTNFVNWVTVIGTALSLVGLGFAIYQIRHTGKVAEKAQEAAEKTQKTISRSLIFTNLSGCSANLEQVMTYIRTNRPESALLRMSDLLGEFIQIRQRIEKDGSGETVEFDDLLSGLTVVRDGLEAHLFKPSKQIDASAMNNQLSLVALELNRLLGLTKLMIERGEQDG